MCGTCASACFLFHFLAMQRAVEKKKKIIAAFELPVLSGLLLLSVIPDKHHSPTDTHILLEQST